NNSWAINSHLTSRRSPHYDVEKIVTGLGMRYARVDGNDYEAVHTRAAELAQSIRVGGGPAVLECMVYRHMAHSTPLMEEKFRKEDTLDRRLAEDPITKLKNTLR